MADEASIMATISSGPILEIAVAAGTEIISPSIRIGLNALFKACIKEIDEGVDACSGYHDGLTATTPAKKEAACDKAADALRRCLEVKVDVIKALAERESLVDDDDDAADWSGRAGSTGSET